MKKIKFIFFTYKRAILLDGAIKSLLKHSSQIEFPIEIIYHKSFLHIKSYQKLKKRYGKKIKFYERKKESIFRYLKLFLHSTNIIGLIRWPQILYRFNSFKSTLERIIINSKSNYICICPDDIVFFKNFFLPNKILSELDTNPNDLFISCTNNINLKKSDKCSKVNYKFIKIKFQKFLSWNIFDIGKENKNLNYNFLVEAGVYHKNSLLKLVKNSLFHNPITMESNILKMVRKIGFYKNIITFYPRICASYQINSVQNDTMLRYNERLQIKPEKLQDIYLQDYEINYRLTHKQKLQNFIIPKKIFFNKIGNKKIYSYSDLLNKIYLKIL